MAYLLCIGGATFEFDPIDQARIATSPAWVQDAGICYLFGCRQHPERTKAVVQFT